MTTREQITLHLDEAASCLKRADKYSAQIAGLELAQAAVKQDARFHLENAKSLRNLQEARRKRD
jgi:hypothetical protein